MNTGRIIIIYNKCACVYEECTEKNYFHYDLLVCTATHKMCVFIHGPTPMRALRVCNRSFMADPAVYARRKRSHLQSEESSAEMLTQFWSIPVYNKWDSVVTHNDEMDIPTLLADFLNSDR